MIGKRQLQCNDHVTILSAFKTVETGKLPRCVMSRVILDCLMLI
jgi:hypothetical protein